MAMKQNYTDKAKLRKKNNKQKITPMEERKVKENRWKQSGIMGDDQTGDTWGRASDLKWEESWFSK